MYPLSMSTEPGATAASAEAAVAPGALPRLEQLRELIAENDRAAVRLLNRRLELVAEIWREKEARGVARTDPERERVLLRLLAEANDGPLSQAGLEHFHGVLLALTKQELGR
jgi:chorismate mutase